jgi:hypothetical protein
LVLAVVALTATAAPAEAAVVPPWRWKRVDLQNQNIAAAGDGFYELQCPDGYIPVSGGMGSPNNAVWIKREYVDYNTNRYVMVIHNWTPTERPVHLHAWCANAIDVGPIVTVTETYTEVNNRAGGYAICPDGYTLLSAGADWNTLGDRHIDVSGPTPLADAWYAAGTSAATDDTLYIDVHCIPSANVPDFTPVLSAADVSGSNTSSQGVFCPAGKRILTGGTWAGPSGTNQRDSAQRATTWSSYPTSAAGWTAGAQVVDSRFGVIAICIPVSTPVLALTDVPPLVSASNTGSFAFSLSDPAGEELSYSCHVDFAPTPCSPGSANPFGPVADGSVTLQVSAGNTSGQTVYKSYDFVVDTTPPTVTQHDPSTAAPLNGDFTMTFSEGVTGVDSSTLRVVADGSTKPLAGTITLEPSANSATSATFDPDAPLVPGQTYRVLLGSGIKDHVGLSLVPPDWQVRATTDVDVPSSVLTQKWDLDKSTKASKGRFIASRDKGATAELTFTAPSSGEVSVFGIRSPTGGRAQVYVDGMLVRTASFYAPRLKRALVFKATGLKSLVKHSLRIVVAGTKPQGSRGTWVNLDSVAYGTTVKQEGALRQSFRTVVDPAAYGGSYVSLTHATKGDTGAKPEYRLRFRGTSVSVHAVLDPGSGRAAIYVDGVLRKKVNLTASGRAYDVDVFTMSLADKVHVIRVVPLGTRSGSKSAVGIDRFVVGAAGQT